MAALLYDTTCDTAVVRTPIGATSATGETLILDEEFDHFNLNLWKHEITMVRAAREERLIRLGVLLLLCVWWWLWWSWWYWWC